jgi:hypothetical protein
MMKTKEVGLAIVMDWDLKFVLIYTDSRVLSDIEECNAVRDWAVGKFNVPFELTLVIEDVIPLAVNGIIDDPPRMIGGEIPTAYVKSFFEDGFPFYPECEFFETQEVQH